MPGVEGVGLMLRFEDSLKPYMMQEAFSPHDTRDLPFRPVSAKQSHDTYAMKCA